MQVSSFAPPLQALAACRGDLLRKSSCPRRIVDKISSTTKNPENPWLDSIRCVVNLQLASPKAARFLLCLFTAR
jgi:hypothetical protein